jgi:hypothetical protein
MEALQLQLELFFVFCLSFKHKLQELYFMVYLRYFASNTKNMVESGDILNYNKIIRKIMVIFNKNTTIRHTTALYLVNI